MPGLYFSAREARALALLRGAWHPLSAKAPAGDSLGKGIGCLFAKVAGLALTMRMFSAAKSGSTSPRAFAPPRSKLCF
jgi:hypothetical protein